MELQNISQSQTIMGDNTLKELEKKYEPQIEDSEPDDETQEARKPITLHIAEFRDNTLNTITNWADCILALIKTIALISATLNYIWQNELMLWSGIAIFLIMVPVQHRIQDSPLTKWLRNSAKRLEKGESKK